MRMMALIVGALLLLISNGHTIAPFATIASAALLIIYANGARPALRLGVLAIVFVVVHCLIWTGIIPAPGAIYYAAASAYGLSHFIPYAAQRLLGGAQRSFAVTLIFPAAYVAVEALLEILTPFGSWSSLAYTQSPAGAYGQLAALGGTPLVSFFIAWTAAAAAWIWENRGEVKTIAPVLCGTVIVVSALSAVPEIRARMIGEPVAVAGIFALSPDPSLVRALNESFGTGKIDERTIAAAQALNDDLMTRTDRAATEGAEIVVWSEGAARLLKRDEQTFLADLARLARERDLYVFAAYGAFDPGAEKPFENRLAAVSPAQGVAWVFDKAHPIFGAEASSVGSGKKQLLFIDTPYGRIGATICHDADFPAFIRQAGANNVDLLLNPADDWQKIQYLHARMAQYRALENGATLVRAANGVSLIVDPIGRVLAQRNSFAGDGLDLISSVPVRRAESYPFGAPAVQVLSAILFGLWALGAIVSKARR